MRFFDFKRIAKSGVLNFWRNSFVSLSSVLVMTITIGVVTSLIFFQAILGFTLGQLESKVDVAVYFVPEASESSILSVKEKVEVVPEVASVLYSSAEEALADFRARHEDDYATLQALDELDTNPLGGALYITAVDPDQYESIANFFDQGIALSSTDMSIIEKVNYNENKQVIDRLLNLKEGAKKLGLVITIILVAISVIITFNTIRLTIYMARDEIGVMRLVGAENAYISGPFMMEGIFYGLVSAVINVIIFFPLTWWFGERLGSFFGLNLFTYYLTNFFQIFVISVLVGTALGAFSSHLAAKKYLKK
jgi:cell division transport system permease protein